MNLIKIVKKVEITFCFSANPSSMGLSNEFMITTNRLQIKDSRYKPEAAMHRIVKI